jgi:hypothetical protein
MPTASRPTFMRRFAGSLRPPRAPDLADMGTAFALDLAMDPEAIYGADSAPPVERAVTAVAPWRLWLGRKLGH